MKKFLGTFLVINAIILALYTIGRNFYLPNTESGLAAVESSTITSASAPSRLLIPKLDINANVQRLGVTNTGHMAAPTNLTDVSWYKFGTPPGERGSAVIAGHEDNALGVDAVFKKLEELESGDEVVVVTENGESFTFQVTRKAIYPYDQVPLQEVFNASDGTYLNLITCAGDWLASARTNDKRLVVYTELVR